MGRPSLGGNYLMAPEGGHEHRKPENQEGRETAPNGSASVCLTSQTHGRFPPSPKFGRRGHHSTPGCPNFEREGGDGQLLKVTEKAGAQRDTTRP